MITTRLELLCSEHQMKILASCEHEKPSLHLVTVHRVWMRQTTCNKGVWKSCTQGVPGTSTKGQRTAQGNTMELLSRKTSLWERQTGDKNLTTDSSLPVVFMHRRHHSCCTSLLRSSYDSCTFQSCVCFPFWSFVLALLPVKESKTKQKHDVTTALYPMCAFPLTGQLEPPKTENVQHRHSAD